MKITLTLSIAIALSLAAAMLGGAAQAQTKLPELKKQPTPQAVLDEHFAALNACDWDRLIAQYPEDAQINLPNGMIVKGRVAIGELFAGFCKESNEGGLKGIHFAPENSTTIDEHLCDPMGGDGAVLGGAVPRLRRLHHP